MLAHVGPVPVEELLPAAGGAGTALVLARAWIWARLRGYRASAARGAIATPRQVRPAAAAQASRPSTTAAGPTAGAAAAMTRQNAR